MDALLTSTDVRPDRNHPGLPGTAPAWSPPRPGRPGGDRLSPESQAAPVRRSPLALPGPASPSGPRAPKAPSGHTRPRTSYSRMLLEVTKMPMPMGMKMRPMMKKAGSTVPAVRMGCQAGRRCCLNAVLSGLRVFTAPPPPPPTAPPPGTPTPPEGCPSASSLAL